MWCADLNKSTAGRYLYFIRNKIRHEWGSDPLPKSLVQSQSKEPGCQQLIPAVFSVRPNGPEGSPTLVLTPEYLSPQGFFLGMDSDPHGSRQIPGIVYDPLFEAPEGPEIHFPSTSVLPNLNPSWDTKRKNNAVLWHDFLSGLARKSPNMLIE